jgi:hypothetical protein
MTVEINIENIIESPEMKKAIDRAIAREVSSKGVELNSRQEDLIRKTICDRVDSSIEKKLKSTIVKRLIDDEYYKAFKSKVSSITLDVFNSINNDEFIEEHILEHIEELKSNTEREICNISRAVIKEKVLELTRSNMLKYWEKENIELAVRDMFPYLYNRGE